MTPRRYQEPRIVYVLRWHKYGKQKQREFKTIAEAVGLLRNFLEDKEGKNYPGVKVIVGRFADTIPEVEAVVAGRNRVHDGGFPVRYQIKWMLNGSATKHVCATLAEAKQKHRARWVLHSSDSSFYLYSAIYVRIT